MSEYGQDIGLYLEVTASDGAAARLQATLACVPIQAVLVRSAGEAQARQLVAMAMAAGAAALIEGDAALARRLEADGVHLPWSEDVAGACKAARGVIGADGIVGAMAGGSRHDAMVLGELGADYIGFGGDIEAALRAELIEWWAEVFEVPCVAFGVESLGEAVELARRGADFLGLALPSAEPVAAAAGRVQAIAAAIGVCGTVRAGRGNRGAT